jgi:hypothetical protein
VDGELMFTANNVVSRIVAADTYTDVELTGAAED